jgi:NADPH:quinone reductase
MKALVCRQFGLPNSLTIEDIPAPTPNKGEVKIRVHAAGVNFPDVLMVQGLYQLKPPFPFSPGLEVSGEIIAVGEGVDPSRMGERVIGVVNWGGIAEEVLAPAHMTLPMPANMSDEDGAVFPIVYGTSHIALAHRANLQLGETLLVLGAGGGVGLTAVEIGKLMGATVIACASTDEKLEVAKQYGADHTINYSNTDLRDAVKKITGDKGVDVIYDPVGGDLFDTAVRCVAWEGRYLVIGFASGRIPDLPANRVLLKNSALVGVFWGAYALNKPKVMQESFKTILQWYADNKLKPYIGARYTLDNAVLALEALMNRQAIGKVVVTMR